MINGMGGKIFMNGEEAEIAEWHLQQAATLLLILDEPITEWEIQYHDKDETTAIRINEFNNAVRLLIPQKYRDHVLIIRTTPSGTDISVRPQGDLCNEEITGSIK